MRGTASSLLELLEKLVSEGVLDRIELVPWDENTRRKVMKKYFGDPDVSPRCPSGTAVYQYLCGLECCSGDYLLHLDGDVIFYCSKAGAWIDEAIEFLQKREPAVLACAPAGPPRTRSLLASLTSKPERNVVPRTRWRQSVGVSTRDFLMDRRKMEDLLPLLRSAESEALEHSLSHTFEATGAERWHMQGSDCFTVHLWRRTRQFYRHRDELIWAVENGVYPYWRTSHPWDLRTDRLRILPWIWAIRRERLRRRISGRP